MSDDIVQQRVSRSRRRRANIRKQFAQDWDGAKADRMLAVLCKQCSTPILLMARPGRYWEQASKAAEILSGMSDEELEVMIESDEAPFLAKGISVRRGDQRGVWVHDLGDALAGRTKGKWSLEHPHEMVKGSPMPDWCIDAQLTTVECSCGRTLSFRIVDLVSEIKTKLSSGERRIRR